jgi:tetratricopeptide (TPR) repeat protein
MRYWFTAIVAAGLAIVAGWFFLLNQSDVLVRVSPSRTVTAPLGGMLLAACALGAALVGLLATGGAVARGWRTARARARTRRDARRREAIARGRDLVWHGETSAARAELARAAEHPALDTSRVALLAETHLQEGDAEAARDLLLRAGPGSAIEPQSLDLLARAAEDLGDRPGAIDALERAYHAAPGSPRLAARLRDLYAAHGRWTEAAALQAEVLLRLRAPGRLASERDTLVGLRYEAGVADADHRRAARHLRGLAREAPDFIPAWVTAGDRYAESGRAFTARRTWVRGLRRRPAAVLLDRIESHDAAAGQPQRTERLLRGLLRRRPDEPGVALRLVRVLIGRNELDEAERTLNGLPDAAAPLADALRGELARARGDARAAADAFARAVGPGLGLVEPWRCHECGASTARWVARCATCGRWDSLRARAEQPAFGERSKTSEPLMRPAT